jgi:hypothetical protein
MIDNAGSPGPLVLRFYRTKAGDLFCRVTEPGTNETWIVQSAERLRELVFHRADPAAGFKSGRGSAAS